MRVGITFCRPFWSPRIINTRYNQVIPEPITKFNPRAKPRSLQYQKDLEEFQKNADGEYVVVPKGSVFEHDDVRDNVEDRAITRTQSPRSTKKGSELFPYLIKVCLDKHLFIFKYIKGNYNERENINL